MELTGREAGVGYAAAAAAWKTVRLGDHVTFLRHGAYARADLVPDGRVKYLHYGDIHTADYVRLDPSIRSMPSLPSDKARRLDRLKDGDLVLVDASEDTEGVGKSVELTAVGTVDIVAGLHTIAARFDTAVLADGFKAYLQFVPAFREHLRRLAAGTKVFSTNRSHVASAEVPLPPVEEQRRIAITLDDVDELLERLTRLIAKRRDLKQGAMQQLLTGRVRLPGFSRRWEETMLGRLGTTFSGLSGKTKADFGQGTGRYVAFMDVMTNVVIREREFDRVRVAATETQNRLRKGDLLFNGSSETPEEVAMCSLLGCHGDDLFLNSFCFGFRLNDQDSVSALFLAYYFRSEVGRAGVKSLAQGSTRYNISKAALLSALLRLPSIKEQIAIATVLSDMDAELAALEARLEKTKALKQAMMQELLTGRTRLVAPEPAHA